MRPARQAAAAMIALSLAWLGAGCGRNAKGPDYEEMYRSTVSLSVSVYEAVEPLRSSRLGLTSADSLLFTYSDDEIKTALKRLKRLETQISRIPAGRLTPLEASRVTVILSWARGVRFALTVVQGHRSNPLLYCWAAEEAIRVVPARIAPPYEGEREAYRRRLLRVPQLLANAELNLENPADLHVQAAIERLDSLAAAFPAISASVARRYGAPLDAELEAARGAILEYRRFAAETLLGSAHGRLILGLETLSSIFGYTELVDADPNMLIAEGKKHIKRLDNEKASIEKRLQLERDGVLPARPAPRWRAGLPFETTVDSVLSNLRRVSATDSAPPAVRRAPVAIVLGAEPAFVAGTRRASCLSIPPAGSPDAAIVTLLSSRPACGTCAVLSRGAERLAGERLERALLDAAPLLLEPQRVRCETGDTAAAVFSSATFEEAWRYLAIQTFAPELKKSDPELYALLVGEWIEDYARMVVVLSLHAGTMTSEGAARYLVETAGLSPAAAAREVLTASVSPEAAYAGISMLLVEEMTRNVAYVFGYGKPEYELVKLLRQWRDLPIPMISPKTRTD